MPSHEENPHEEFDEILWDIAQSLIPEVRASDKYMEARAEYDACAERFKAALTKDQWRMYLEAEAQNNNLVSMEDDAAFRKIFFYGLAQGIEIGRRSKNGRTKRASNI